MVKIDQINWRVMYIKKLSTLVSDMFDEGSSKGNKFLSRKFLSFQYFVSKWVETKGVKVFLVSIGTSLCLHYFHRMFTSKFEFLKDDNFSFLSLNPVIVLWVGHVLINSFVSISIGYSSSKLRNYLLTSFWLSFVYIGFFLYIDRTDFYWCLVPLAVASFFGGLTFLVLDRFEDASILRKLVRDIRFSMKKYLQLNITQECLYEIFVKIGETAELYEFRCFWSSSKYIRDYSLIGKIIDLDTDKKRFELEIKPCRHNVAEDYLECSVVNNLKIKFSDGNALEEHLVEMQKQHWTLSTDNFWLLHSFAAYLKGSKDCSDEELKEKIFEILIRSKLSSHKDIVVKRSFTEGENFLDDPPEGSN